MAGYKSGHYTFVMVRIESLLQQLKKNWSHRHIEENLPFISVGVLAAITCALYAIVFAAVEKMSHKYFTQHPYFIFIAAPIFMLLSFILVKFFSPGASGSGIPQVMACIDKPYRHLSGIFLRKSVIGIKILSSLCAILAGAAIGREGPSLQISAAIANQVGIFFQKLKIPIKMDQLLITGAASGLAAAFNTPIGGIVYAIEELSQDHVRSYKDVLLISVVISGLTAQLISGNYLYLGFPEINNHLSFFQFVIISMVSLTAGILGATFSKILGALISWRSSKSVKTQYGIIIIVGLMIATTFFYMGQRGIYSGKESINYVLFSDGPLEILEFLSRFCLPLVSSMTGIAGGIFAPALSAGASFGGFVAGFFDPSLRTVLGLCGMVGFLTGVTRTPITAFILVLEMTNRHSAVFSMMLASVLSTFGAHLITEYSFYEEALQKIKDQNPLPLKDN